MLPFWARSSVCFALTLSGLATATGQTNPTQQENAKPGDPSWALTNPATDREIEGFGSAPSINRGESIVFYVNTPFSYTLEIFRIGWYGGAGARKMLPTVTLAGVPQPFPSPDPATGLIECHWGPSFVLQVPNDPADPTNWMSGIYLAKLTTLGTQKQSYILFVVRDDSRSSELLFQNSVATYEAYNTWGGRSLYTNPRAFKVSFNRPFNNRPFYNGAGSGDFFGWGWEAHMLRFLEREGYDVTYTTDLDTHARGETLLGHKAFLVVGHDEYWSWQMRDNVEKARDHGVSLGFFGANIAYWQVRFEPSPATGAPDRTMVCYKSADLDPITHSGNPSDQQLATTTFRSPPISRPENSLIGIMYDGAAHNFIQADLVISDSNNWVFEGTGLRSGDHLPGLLGYEVDRVFTNIPASGVRLGHSPYQDGCVSGSLGCVTHYSDMTVYELESGATVLATGTMHWNRGLDGMTFDSTSQGMPAVQQATRNILNRFLHPLPYYLEPRSLSFPSQLVGSNSPIQEIVIVNREGHSVIMDQENSGDFTHIATCSVVLSAHERCVVSVSFAPRAVGARTGNEIFNLRGDPANPIQVQLAGIGVDYTLSAGAGSSTTAIVKAGEVAEFDLNLASLGFSGTVSLSCDTAPLGFDCSVKPSSVVVSGGTSSKIVVTVDTSRERLQAMQQVTHLPVVRLLNRELALIFVLLFLLSLIFAASLISRRPFSLLFASILLAVTLFNSCTGVVSDQIMSHPATPSTVTYHATVKATAERVTRSISLELIVQYPDREKHAPIH